MLLLIHPQQILKTGHRTKTLTQSHKAFTFQGPRPLLNKAKDRVKVDPALKALNNKVVIFLNLISCHLQIPNKVKTLKIKSKIN